RHDIRQIAQFGNRGRRQFVASVALQRELAEARDAFLAPGLQFEPLVAVAQRLFLREAIPDIARAGDDDPSVLGMQRPAMRLDGDARAVLAAVLAPDPACSIAAVADDRVVFALQGLPVRAEQAHRAPADDFLARIADHVAEGLVDVDIAQALALDKYDRISRRVERRAEPHQGLFAALAQQ